MFSIAPNRLSWLFATIVILFASLLHSAEVALAPSGNIHVRGSLLNSRIRFDREKKGHVAFIGGSITEMNGYRPMVCTMLRARFPDTQFTFTDAGIASTCSTTGAFRLQRDVLSKGPVDLFFVEFAVNDDQDAAHARRVCIRGMEGIVRRTRAHNPRTDIVLVHFPNPSMIETLQAGRTPRSAGSHEEVARHYRIPSIYLAKEVAQRITAGMLTWQQYGGTHPAPPGNRICADMIGRLLDLAWKEKLSNDARMTAHPMPSDPLDADNYGKGKLVDPKAAETDGAWKLHVPTWKDLPGSSRQRFMEIPMLCTESPEAKLTFRFQGRAIGAYIVAGPDAGTVEAAVDDGKFLSVNLFHRYSRGLHYPRTVMFAAGLAPGPHVLRLQMTPEHHADASGTAMRIMRFVVNE